MFLKPLTKFEMHKASQRSEPKLQPASIYSYCILYCKLQSMSRYSKNRGIKRLFVCVYLLQVSHGVQVNMLEQVFSGEDPEK